MKSKRFTPTNKHSMKMKIYGKLKVAYLLKVAWLPKLKLSIFMFLKAVKKF